MNRGLEEDGDDRTMAAVTTIVTSHLDSNENTQARFKLSYLVYRDASTRTRATLSIPS